MLIYYARHLACWHVGQMMQLSWKWFFKAIGFIADRWQHLSVLIYSSSCIGSWSTWFCVVNESKWEFIVWLPLKNFNYAIIGMLNFVLSISLVLKDKRAFLGNGNLTSKGRGRRRVVFKKYSDFQIDDEKIHWSS